MQGKQSVESLSILIKRVGSPPEPGNMKLLLVSASAKLAAEEAAIREGKAVRNPRRKSQFATHFTIENHYRADFWENSADD